MVFEAKLKLQCMKLQGKQLAPIVIKSYFSVDLKTHFEHELYAFGLQSIACGSQFSPSTMCTLSGLASSTFIHWVSSPAKNSFFYF